MGDVLNKLQDRHEELIEDFLRDLSLSRDRAGMPGINLNGYVGCRMMILTITTIFAIVFPKSAKCVFGMWEFKYLPTKCKMVCGISNIFSDKSITTNFALVFPIVRI